MTKNQNEKKALRQHIIYNTGYWRGNQQPMMELLKPDTDIRTLYPELKIL